MNCDIGHQGIQNLANALENNNVIRMIFASSTSSQLFINTDTLYAISGQ